MTDARSQPRDGRRRLHALVAVLVWAAAVAASAGLGWLQHTVAAAPAERAPATTP